MEEKKTENCVNKRREELIRIFEIPEIGVEIIDQILTPQEQEILLLLDKSGSYSNSELQNMLTQNDFTENAKEAESVSQRCVEPDGGWRRFLYRNVLRKAGYFCHR